MDTIISRNIKVDGLDVHYLRAGQGDPLVVIHGGSGDARDWLKNMQELSASYTVYVPDMPGFGGSQALDGDYFIPEMAEFVEKFSQKLGLNNFHLMGQSLGGGVALSYALKFPHRIKKLVLVSSLCLGREIALWVRFLASPRMCRLIGAVTMALLRGVKWLVDSFLAPIGYVIPLSRTSIVLGSCITTLKEQTTVFINRLSEIMVPTLVVWGARDPIVPARHAYAAAELIPDCQVKVFADGGHSVYRDELHEFSHLLRGFLG